MPAPTAVIIARISSWSRILSLGAFSTLSILPRSGKIAWKRRSRPCLAEPPAESPSTRYSSQSCGFFSEQSASFPGSVPASNPLFLKMRSRAFRAASLAFDETMHFSIIFADEVSLRLFEQLAFPRVVVENTGQGRAEAGEMAAAIDGVDAVGEA